VRDSLVRLTAIAGKEVRELVRDPVTLGVAILLPLVMMVLFTYAITLDVRDIRLAVLDEDGSPESRAYVNAFLRSGYFRLAATVRRPGELDQLLARGAARIALVIPADFARSLHQGLPADVQTLLDGSLANTAVVALNYADAITEAYARQLQEETVAARLGGPLRLPPAIRVEARVRFTRHSAASSSSSPGSSP
jgi:ABC-2 type transport system permease protein